jgi:hypothetical protein
LNLIKIIDKKPIIAKIQNTISIILSKYFFFIFTKKFTKNAEIIRIINKKNKKKENL